jgi:DNA modification methylase
MARATQQYLFDAPTCAVLHGDSRTVLNDFKDCVDLIVTSPPYADARKKHYDSIHPDRFADWFMTFHETFWNVLKPEGSLVINIKDKVVDGVRHRYPWHTIDALSKAGWYCIDDYVWSKPNPMPGHWPTRLRDGWEYCFHLAKSKKPYIDQDAVRVPIGNWVKSRLSNLNDGDYQRHNSENDSGFGRNISYWLDKNTVKPSNVLSIAVVGKNKGHPAVYPIELPLFFIKLLSPENGLILDPFGGSGTTGLAAMRAGRDCVLVDNNEEYADLSVKLLRANKDKEDRNILHIKNPDKKNRDWDTLMQIVGQHRHIPVNIQAI